MSVLTYGGSRLTYGGVPLTYGDVDLSDVTITFSPVDDVHTLTVEDTAAVVFLPTMERHDLSPLPDGTPVAYTAVADVHTLTADPDVRTFTVDPPSHTLTVEGD